MRRNNFLGFLILFAWAVSACQATPITPSKLPFSRPSPTTASAEETRIPTVQAPSTPTKVALPSATSSPTILPTLTQTASPMPAPQVDLSRFDPDVHPAIDVLHNPPLIAGSDEMVKIEFSFVCALPIPGNQCDYNVTLFFTYGNKNDFTSMTLHKEISEEGLEHWTATLPATNAVGEELRYYLQVSVPQASFDLRYPVEGTIDLFAAPDLIPIDLPAQKPEEPSELALAVPWGSGPKAVGIEKREGYPLKQGPPALDVAEDGRIALLDFVNGRVLVYDSKDQTFAFIPLPFGYVRLGDLQFDRGGHLAIFDGFGEPIEQPTVDIPRLYRMSSDGSIDKVAPVFVNRPYMLTEDLEVLDFYDRRLVMPFSPTGEVNSREEQRHKQNPALIFRFVEHLDPYVARFGDVIAGLAFEMHSVSPLGAIIYFEKTPQGYVAIFFADLIRAVWFDSSGTILKDVTLPNDQYSEVYPEGQVAIDQSGSLYVLGSTVRGIEVRFYKAP